MREKREHRSLRYLAKRSEFWKVCTKIGTNRGDRGNDITFSRPGIRPVPAGCSRCRIKRVSIRIC